MQSPPVVTAALLAGVFQTRLIHLSVCIPETSDTFLLLNTINWYHRGTRKEEQVLFIATFWGVSS